jgi:hypothetical protein
VRGVNLVSWECVWRPAGGATGASCLRCCVRQANIYGARVAMATVHPSGGEPGFLFESEAWWSSAEAGGPWRAQRALGRATASGPGLKTWATQPPFYIRLATVRTVTNVAKHFGICIICAHWFTPRASGRNSPQIMRAILGLIWFNGICIVMKPSEGKLFCPLKSYFGLFFIMEWPKI